MRGTLVTVCAVLLTAGLGGPVPASAQADGQFAVTITNLTRDQTFTPVLVVTHTGQGFAYSSSASPRCHKWPSSPRKAMSLP